MTQSINPTRKNTRIQMIPLKLEAPSPCPISTPKNTRKMPNENVLFTPPDVRDVMNRQEIIVSKCFLNNKISHLFISDPRRMKNLAHS